VKDPELTSTTEGVRAAGGGSSTTVAGLGVAEGEAKLGAATMSHPILRPNRMLIICVHMNQVYIHTI
jgi:hypothetical protein